jgi:hypothetical protein
VVSDGFAELGGERISSLTFQFIESPGLCRLRIQVYVDLFEFGDGFGFMDTFLIVFLGDFVDVEAANDFIKDDHSLHHILVHYFVLLADDGSCLQHTVPRRVNQLHQSLAGAVDAVGQYDYGWRVVLWRSILL